MHGKILPSGDTLTVTDYIQKQRPASATSIDAPSGPGSCNLYVKNFSNPQIDDLELKGIFSQFGEVANAVIMRDENQISKGFGFVSFKNLSDAQRALQAFKSEDPSALYVREALSKEQRQ